MPEFKPTREQFKRANGTLRDVLAGKLPVKVGKGYYNPSLTHVLLEEMLCGPQHNMMAVGGARSGKTFTITKALVARARRAPCSRQAILRLHLKDVKEAIGMDTLPKVMRLRYPSESWEYSSGAGLFRIFDKRRPAADASEIWLLGLDDQDRTDKILGKEFCGLYYNECSQLSYGSVLTGMSRLAQLAAYWHEASQTTRTIVNRVYYDLNPVGTGHFSYSLFIEGHEPGTMKRIADPDDYVFMYVNPGDNEENLAPGYIQNILERMPEIKRKRFLEGRYVASLQGALWTLEMIEGLRLMPGAQSEIELRALNGDVPPFVRVVVAVDPSGASGEKDTSHDQIGIVVAAIGSDKHLYILEDLTGWYSPDNWGKVAVQAYFRWKADCVVAEQNYGGDMVRFVINGAMLDGVVVGQNVPVKLITSSRGKHLRAEPISAMYERKMVHHVGDFALLEKELINFTNAGYLGSGSPNRADALVFAATDLFGNNLAYGLTEYLQQEQTNVEEERKARMQTTAERLRNCGGAIAKLSEDGEQPTLSCPRCSATCIAPVSSGGYRCSRCGEQFGYEVIPSKPFNRSSLVAMGLL